MTPTGDPPIPCNCNCHTKYFTPINVNQVNLSELDLLNLSTQIINLLYKHQGEKDDLTEFEKITVEQILEIYNTINEIRNK